MPGIITFALDKSVRRTDADGRLHVDLTNISKATVNPYYGREIPGAAELGLKPDTVYQVFRDPDALAKGAATFNNVPLLDEHIIVSADDPKKNNVVGSTGTDAVFDGEYLKNSLVVWDADSIRRIESGEQKEISCAYRYVAVKEAGTHKGLTYDLKMASIVANHVALVREGRAGPDVVVADSAIGDRRMKFSALKGKLAATFATDSALTPADRRYLYVALDEMEEDVDAEDEVEETEAQEKVKEKAEEMKAKDRKKAADAKRAKDKAAKDKAAKDKAAKDKAARDARRARDEDWEPEEHESEEEDQDEAAEDESEEDEDESEAEKKAKDKRAKDRKAARDRAAKDAEKAMDAAIAKARAGWDALAKAKSDVMPIVGEVHGCDTAAAVYKFALDAKGVKAKSDDPEVLAQMVGLLGSVNSNTTPFAMDHKTRASVGDIIPGLGRYA